MLNHLHTAKNHHYPISSILMNEDDENYDGKVVSMNFDCRRAHTFILWDFDHDRRYHIPR